MKKSELRQIIKEEIKNVVSEGLFDRFKKKSKPEPEELDNWYWPIADEAIEILKKDHPMVKLSRVPRPISSETYIGITASGFEGISPRAEKRFKVYFDENNKVTNIEED